MGVSCAKEVWRLTCCLFQYLKRRNDQFLPRVDLFRGLEDVFVGLVYGIVMLEIAILIKVQGDARQGVPRFHLVSRLLSSGCNGLAGLVSFFLILHYNT